MKSTLKNVANERKRACPECHRRKIRCGDSVTESQQMLSKEVTTEEELDNHTTTEDNFTAMERDRDYDYKTNKSSAAKRVRKGPQGQQPLPSAAGPSSAGPFSAGPPSTGPSSSSTPSAAPVQAVFAGIPTTVPSPEDPVNMYDVEEFLLHLEVVKGVAKGDFKKSEDKLIAILGKWNSVYTIGQNPATNHAENRGLEVGRNLANLAIFSKREPLLKHLLDYFKELEFKAEENQRAFTAKDHQEYAEFGHISWVYMQLSQGRFAKYACLGITEATHGAGVFEREEENKRLARLQAEMESHKVIENNGGMVFGAGGGARGGFDFEFGGDKPDAA